MRARGCEKNPGNFQCWKVCECVSETRLKVEWERECMRRAWIANIIEVHARNFRRKKRHENCDEQFRLNFLPFFSSHFFLCFNEESLWKNENSCGFPRCFSFLLIFYLMSRIQCGKFSIEMKMKIWKRGKFVTMGKMRKIKREMRTFVDNKGDLWRGGNFEYF